MDTAKHLRFRPRVVDNTDSKLVSPGAAFRLRKFDELRARSFIAERERRRAWSNNPDNPMLTARRREELLAQREKAE